MADRRRRAFAAYPSELPLYNTAGDKMRILLLAIFGMALCENDPDPDEIPRLARDLPGLLNLLLLPMSLAAAMILLLILARYS